MLLHEHLQSGALRARDEAQVGHASELQHQRVQLRLRSGAADGARAGVGNELADRSQAVQHQLIHRRRVQNRVRLVYQHCVQGTNLQCAIVI